jgi:hypothetical protein
LVFRAEFTLQFCHPFGIEKCVTSVNKKVPQA